MSRTHAHTPAWVLQLRPENQIVPDHWCDRTGRCDFNEPITATTKSNLCDWDIPWHEVRKHYRGDTEKDHRHSDWWAPDRSHNRDTLRGFAAEYNTHGAVADDTDAPTRDHRHHTYKGGYWN